MACRNICITFKPTTKKIGKHGFKLRPEENIRYCILCRSFVKWVGGFRKIFKRNVSKAKLVYVDKYHCPCCGQKLRSNVRSKKYKALHRAKFSQQV